MFDSKGLISSVAAVFLAAWAVNAQASIITAVNQTGGSVETGVDFVTLTDGVEVFTDRVHVLSGVPAMLEGSDLVRLENDNKADAAFSVDVTIGQLALLYVLLDNRVGGGDNTSDPTPLSWMTDGSIGLTPFIDTNVDIGIDEGADGAVENFFSLFVTLAQPGTYTFGAQNDGSNRNMYAILAAECLVVPEPGTASLAGLALIGLVMSVRRRRG